MNDKFYIQLENGDIYLLAIRFNFQKYVIKKGYLYKNHKKLGKIIGIKPFAEELNWS